MRNRILAALAVGLLSTATAFAAGEQRTWDAKCASCHGADGKGETANGKKLGIEDMTTKKWQSSHTDEQIKAALAGGHKVKAGGEEQDHTSVPEAKIDGLVKIIRGLAK